MKLYSAKMAPNPRRVTLFIAEKALQNKVEVVDIDLVADAKSPSHKSRNPQGLVPVLELPDGRFLSESRAICTYLEGIEPEPNLMGEGLDERAFIEMHDRQIELSLLYPLAQWVRHGHPGLASLEHVQVAQWADVAKAKALHAIGQLSSQLEAHEYVAGKRFTIADITAFCALDFVRLMKYRAWEEFAPIGRWRDALMARPSFG